MNVDVKTIVARLSSEYISQDLVKGIALLAADCALASDFVAKKGLQFFAMQIETLVHDLTETGGVEEEILRDLLHSCVQVLDQLAFCFAVSTSQKAIALVCGALRDLFYFVQNAAKYPFLAEQVLKLSAHLLWEHHRDPFVVESMVHALRYQLLSQTGSTQTFFQAVLVTLRLNDSIQAASIQFLYAIFRTQSKLVVEERGTVIMTLQSFAPVAADNRANLASLISLLESIDVPDHYAVMQKLNSLSTAAGGQPRYSVKGFRGLVDVIFENYKRPEIKNESAMPAPPAANMVQVPTMQPPAINTPPPAEGMTPPPPIDANGGIPPPPPIGANGEIPPPP